MKSMRIGLCLAMFFVILLPVYVLGRHAANTLDWFARQTVEEEMLGQARMVGEQYRMMMMGTEDGKMETALAACRS